MRNLKWTALILLACGLVGSAEQAAAPVEQGERNLTARVAGLLARLVYREGDKADTDRYYGEMDRVTDQLREEIDSYIALVANSTPTSKGIEERLDGLLTRKPHPSYGDLPFARVADLRAGKSLVVAYTVVRPPHHDSATVRGYRAGLARFELMAVTGDDFDGYNMFKKELRSPLSDELWMLAWGQAETANGKIVRFRLYAFDGEMFRTVWSPDDMVDAELRFSAPGFSIDHYRRPNQIHDEFVLTAQGPLKTTPN
jgi:hypothetical protein